MRKLTIGLLLGAGIAAGGTAAYAADSLRLVQAALFPVELVVDGRKQAMGEERPLLNYNGYAYAPVRMLAEQMRGTVSYDGANGLIDVRTPDAQWLRQKLKIGMTEGEAASILGDAYTEVVFPDKPQERLRRYDVGVRGGYRVLSIRQQIETWADVEGLQEGDVNVQVLTAWEEGRLKEYDLAYRSDSGKVRYEVDEERLQQVQERLMEALPSIGDEHGIVFLRWDSAGQELTLAYRESELMSRSHVDKEMVRKAVWRAAGLAPLRPFPLRLDAIPLQDRADFTGIIRKIDLQAGRLLLVDELSLRALRGGEPSGVWVSIGSQSRMVHSDGTEVEGLEQLQVGEMASVWSDGIILESDPPQITALLLGVGSR